MIARLPADLLTRPIAHRGLHDHRRGIPENSLIAIEAAIAAGYGIEIDLQLSADDEAIVFHDYDLMRMTGRKGAVREFKASELESVALANSQDVRIPTLLQLLEVVAGRVPLLIELKDQDGALGSNVGRLEAATARALVHYQGEVAVMSLNPYSIAEMSRLAPTIPRGLVTSSFRRSFLSTPWSMRARLRQIPDINRVKASFISHDIRDLRRPRVQALRGAGIPVICWTVRSPKAEVKARALADNITFEGYKAYIPE